MAELSEKDFEDKHVHQVYDAIAAHFSATRYKPWPLIANLLDSLPSGSIGLDAGCGNGKYLHGMTSSKLLIGLDHSRNLLQIASNSCANEVLQADCISMPWRRGIFDFAISIATIHHFMSQSRRCQAVVDLLDSVTDDGGHVIIQVWAFEQRDEKMLKKRTAIAVPLGTPSEQDIFVPWSMQKEFTKPDDDHPSNLVFQRYYHLFQNGELVQLVHDAAEQAGLVISDQPPINKPSIQILSTGWERGNYYVHLRKIAPR